MTRDNARSEAAMMVLKEIVAIETAPRLNHDDDPGAYRLIDEEIEKIREWLHYRAFGGTRKI